MSNKEIYVPSDEALKFIAFLRATGNEDNSSPEAHYKIADILFSSKKKDKNVLIECSRGLGKSTVAEYAVIYAAALGVWPGFGKCPFIVFLGANQDGNVKQFFKNVASKIHNSELLSSLIDVKRQTDSEIELVNKEGVKMFIVGKGMNVNWRGARSPDGHRPSLLLADDVLHNDSATSEAVRNTIDTNWFSSALPALAPNHKIIYIGTPLNDEDLLHKLKNSGEYSVVRFPLCTEFPCSEEEYESVWPERFTYEYTKGMYNQFNNAGKAQNFYCEYMLQITDLSTLLVEEDDINWFDYTAFMKNKEKYNYYISTDFATSTKKSADYSTIGVWAIGSDESWFLVDGQCKRQTMQDNLEDLFKYVHRWKPLSVGIESSGQQGGFISILQEMMMSRNLWFQLAKKRGSKEFGIRPVKDKVHRFVTGVQPKFKQGKIWFPKPEIIKNRNPYLLELLDEMVNELSKFTLAGGVKALAHDDCVSGDTLVMMADGTSKRIDNLTIGEYVMTFDIDFLTQPIEKVMITGVKEVSTYIFSDGSSITMTDNHPVLTSVGYIPAELLTSEDEVVSWNNKYMQEESGLKKDQDTTRVQLYSETERENGYISLSGKKQTENSQKGFTSTIKTVIKTITNWRTWNYCQQVIIQSITGFKEIWKNKRSTWQKLDHWLMSGTKQKSVRIGQEKTSNLTGQKCLSTTISIVDGAVNQLKLDSLTGLPTATGNVNFKPYKQMLQDRKNFSANGVGVPLSGIEKNQDVVKNAAIIYLCEKKDRRLIQTYNLEVKRTHNFIANGIVVHNCLDLLNQLSEMDTIAPNNYEEDNEETFFLEDGTMVAGIWDDDFSNEKNYNTSTVF